MWTGRYVHDNTSLLGASLMAICKVRNRSPRVFAIGPCSDVLRRVVGARRLLRPKRYAKLANA